MRHIFHVSVLLLIQSFFCATANVNILLKQAGGEVGAENFTYWTVNYSGNLAVFLISLEGDADLYVSEQTLNPTYEHEKYDLSSATCGFDYVYIPEEFKRPVGVGVYGHPSYNSSSYLLVVYFVSDEDNVKEEDFSRVDETAFVGKGQETTVKSRVRQSLIMSGLWALLEIFELSFLI